MQLFKNQQVFDTKVLEQKVLDVMFNNATQSSIDDPRIKINKNRQPAK